MPMPRPHKRNTPDGEGEERNADDQRVIDPTSEVWQPFVLPERVQRRGEVSTSASERELDGW